MHEASTTVPRKFWPTPQDYNEAVQNPRHSFGDAELQAAEVLTDAMGLPRPITGAFASVYKLSCGEKNYALRCFLRDIPDTQWRYGRIADYLRQNPLEYIVDFTFQFQGVKVAGKWFPVLRMDWVDGLTLDNYLRQHLPEGQLAPTLAEQFRTMCLKLEALGIAHGDLQHGNIMLRDDQLVLVDYDGMYVPHIDAPRSNELGHRNYQHPGRTGQHFGPYLDNFSAWVVYTSLRALTVDPSLYERLGAGDDCLLFRRGDFVDPTNSCAFAVLENALDEEIVNLAHFIRAQLQVTPEKVPPLSAPPLVATPLPPLQNNAPRSRQEQLSRAAYAATSVRALAPSSNIASQQAGTIATAGSIEPELLRPTPRQVKINTQSHRFNPRTLSIGTALVPLGGLLFSSLAQAQQNIGAALLTDMSFSLPLVTIIGISIWWRPLIHKDMVRNGVAVSGTILEKKVERSTKFMHLRTTDWAHEKVKCMVIYEYPHVRNGKVQLVRSSAELSPEEYRDVDEGQKVTILYRRDGRSLIYKLSQYKATI